MRKVLSLVRPSPAWCRRLAAAAVVAAVAAGAFCWGRHGATPEAAAQQPGGVSLTHVTASPGADTTDYAKRVVGYLYNNVPITREELGEYLIARFGAERLDFLINRKIVEMECQAKGVAVTDAEVEVQFREDLRAFGAHMTEKDFVNQVLKRFNKSLYEWKEDVIRPKLAMQKLVRPTVTVTPDDVQQAFEARYGPKVQCRMIVLQKDDPRRSETWKKVSESEEAFREKARSQFIPELASRGGEVPPVHKHFGDARIEKEAFSLKEGQVSALMQVQDGTWVILKCDKHLVADATKRVEDERMALSKEIFERKLALKVPEVFAEMRKQANPRALLGNPSRPDVATAIAAPAQPAPASPTISVNDPRPTPPNGN